MDKILALQVALENIGISTELDTEAEWFANDRQTHYGIELSTNMDYGEDCWSFLFTPDCRYITDCRQAPIKNSKKKSKKR